MTRKIMNRLRHAPFVWGILPVLLLTVLLFPGVGEASGGWKLVTGANPSATFDGLRAVAAVATNDVWAVGAYSKTQNTHQPLIEHWTGTTWNVVPSPSPDLSANLLLGVVAISSQDAWAVGNYYSQKKGAEETLIDHWNGTKWSVAPNPNPSSTANGLNGVTAISAHNVWAVGQYQPTSGNTQPLIEHWNGSTWAVVTSPVIGGGATLLSVAASSANSIWAVGDFTNSSGNAQTLVEYWNGSAWSIISTPNPGPLFDVLNAVTVVSANNVWAVGQYEASTSFNTLIEHWDGTQWSIVSSPSPGSDNTLSGVTEVSANSIWAVGQTDQGLGGRTLVEYWNGSIWSVVSSPNKGSFDNWLFAVARVPSTTKAWAVGQYSNTTTISKTLFEYHQ
jgi:hypothetical protein